jgi:hypothetical protein
VVVQERLAVLVLLVKDMLVVTELLGLHIKVAVAVALAL